MEALPKLHIALAGCAGVGKTSFVRRVVYQDWNSIETPTVGIDFQTHVVCFEPIDAEDGEIVHTEKVVFNIWDTAGQERFASIISSYFRQKEFIVIVYAIDDFASFKQVDEWLERDKAHAFDTTNYVLLGTKADSNRQVSRAEAEKKVRKLGFVMFAETSSKEDSATYATPLEVMKQIAQGWWQARLEEQEELEHDIMAAKAGYSTSRFPDAKLPVELQDPPPTKRGCGC